MTPALAPDPVTVRDFGWPDFVAGRPAGRHAWLPALRGAAMARFTAMGLPSVRDEDWRQTPIGPIARTAFRRATPAKRVVEKSVSSMSKRTALRPMPAA